MMMMMTHRIVVGNGNCSGKFAVGIAYDLNHANNLDAFVGFPCSVGQLYQFIARPICLPSGLLFCFFFSISSVSFETSCFTVYWTHPIFTKISKIDRPQTYVWRRLI